MSDTDWESIAYSMQEKVKGLEQTIKEQAARIARLENGIKIVLFADDEISELAAESLREKLNESPQQSLAAIQADAVDYVATAFSVENGCCEQDICSSDLYNHAQSLRDKA